VFDSNGDIILSDEYNQCLRRVDAVTGIITTIAGNGTGGYSGDGGLAVNALVNYPKGLAFDLTGSLLFADSSNDRIRRIDASTGIITTIAGTGVVGQSGDGGLSTAAQLYAPYAVAVDPSGIIYIADYFSHKIRILTPVATTTGLTTGQATTGQATTAGLTTGRSTTGRATTGQFTTATTTATSQPLTTGMTSQPLTTGPQGAVPQLMTVSCQSIVSNFCPRSTLVLFLFDDGKNERICVSLLYDFFFL
jgi:streptogramin lyase